MYGDVKRKVSGVTAEKGGISGAKALSLVHIKNVYYHSCSNIRYYLFIYMIREKEDKKVSELLPAVFF